MPDKKFCVAICGGGIAGLTTALVLSKYADIEVDIYEAAKEFTELGAGIGVWPRIWKILKTLGLDDEIAQAVDMPDGFTKPVFQYRKSDQSQGVGFYSLETPGGLLRLSRPYFQQVLLRHLPTSCRIHLSKRLDHFTQTASPAEPIRLYFTDRTSTTCDVLVGADGVKSKVRASLMHELAQRARDRGREAEANRVLKLAHPIWSGAVAYRSLIPADRLAAMYPGHRAINVATQYIGKDGYILVYPINKGRFINFVAFDVHPEKEGRPYDGPWVTSEVSRAELVRIYDGWEEEVQSLLQCIDPQMIMKWAIHIAQSLPSFTSGRVAIIGDAAHANVPHQGAGAGQAIEDAYLLGTLLGQNATTRASIPSALSIFDRVRRPFALETIRRSHLNGELFTFRHHEFANDVQDPPDEDDREKLRDLSEQLVKNWEWCWKTDAGADVSNAVRLLQEAMA